jgi:Restriction endonuclease XhoI
VTVTRQDFIDAVTAYWGAKELQLGSSKIAQAVGAGTAGSVRGGKHFDAIAALIAKFFVEAGFPPESIRMGSRSRIALPGFYRPQKDWDVVVVHGGTLAAAFELKALGGPSFGNNYNNRIEEALGSAVDVQRATLENLYPGEMPWLGYFFILEDAEGSRRAVRLAQGALPPGAEWQGASIRNGSRCSVPAWSANDYTTQSVTSRRLARLPINPVSRSSNLIGVISRQP